MPGSCLRWQSNRLGPACVSRAVSPHALMRTRNIMTLGTISLLSLGILLIFGFKIRQRSTFSEPTCDGLNLTEWLDRIAHPPMSWSGEDTNHPLDVAQRAVRAIGTNAVPTLLRLNRARDSRITIALADLLDKQSLARFSFSRAATLNDYAYYGFQTLGTNAQTAIPSLLNDLHAEDPALRRRAAIALHLIGHTLTP